MMLNINWSTLLFQIMNFLIMVFILYRFFFKPVVRVLDQRSKRVTNALDEAEKREREADEMRVEYERRVAEAEEQVILMRQQAEEELARTKKQYLDEVRQEIEEMRDKAASEIQEARQQAIYQHRREVGHLVTTLSARLMREAGGEPFQQTSMEQFVEQLSALPTDEYRHGLQASEAQVVHVQLVSASDLGSDDMARIEGQIQRMVQRPTEMIYKIDPALVAGATVRFGDIVVDGSLAGQLQALNERYLSDLGQGKG
jgi:F-type H+-transporting ATPase subunit b